MIEIYDPFVGEIRLPNKIGFPVGIHRVDSLSDLLRGFILNINPLATMVVVSPPSLN